MSDLWEIFGIDVSFWQGVWEWDVAARNGVRFAFIRAGSITKYGGNCYTDDQFHNNALYAPDHLPVGFYWYFRPEYDAIKQADYFCDLIRNSKMKLPPVLDIEDDGGLTPAQVTSACAKFIAHVYTELGVWCEIYSRSYFMRNKMIYNQIFDECNTWIARYTDKPLPYGNPGDSPILIPPWGKHNDVWQKAANTNAAEDFGGHGPPNGDDDVDFNFFHGTEVEFLAWSGGSPPVTEYEFLLTFIDPVTKLKFGEGWINQDYILITEE